MDAAELEQIRSRYPHLGAVLTEPCFLTKLVRRWRAEEFTDDLVLEKAESDEEFRRIRYTGFPLTEVLLLAAVFAPLARRRRRS